MTSTRNKLVMQLSMPPLVGLVRSDSCDSFPSTPGPHTPLPYESTGFFHGSIDPMQLDESSLSVGVGSKRGRDEEDEKRQEKSWTDEEIDVIHTTLVHPFRPISTHYPPGELPPPNVIDELTNQILNYAFRNHSPRDSSSRSGSVTNHLSPVAGSDGCDGWTHSWDVTRKKLFEIALAESKFGQDAEERKMTREERQHRPGLRRVDSMDFLDQAEDDARASSSIGKALKLSTTLQNSAKQDPILSLSRSTSVGSGLISEPLCAAGPPAAPVATITLTPASPSSNPPLRRKSSFRSNSSSSKPLRPASLLQRGRSFTADDLRAEADAEDKDKTNPPPLLCSEPLVISPEGSPSKTSPAIVIAKARLTRSQSSSSTLDPPAHAVRDFFLASPKPSTTDRSALALPLPIEESKSVTAKSSGWSDSEDEAPSQPRKVKKLKQGKKLKPAGGLRIPDGIASDQILLAGELRSPFEEKEEPQF